MSYAEETISRQFLDSIVSAFQAQKRGAEKAIVQLPDEKLHIPLDANTNSIAVIMRHMAGNLRSRFTEFLTTDGEKPERDRDREFVENASVSREQLMADWESGWRVLFDTLTTLKPEDLTKTITIRQQPYGVIDALHRALVHQGYHVGQITQLARFLAKDQWATITIPRGGSNTFNRAMHEKHAGPATQ